MKLYDELADWWPLMSDPADYQEEAGIYAEWIRSSSDPAPRTVLELGSGGGNNASHMKQDFQLTLVDVAPGMLAVSRRLNPECEHEVGDMRTVRLNRLFDAVFVHDAICYMTSRDDLRATLTTAFEHTRPGGVALFVPDFIAETYEEGTSEGGHDGEFRSMRYLAWNHDPDPTDDSYSVDYAYMLKEPDGRVRVEHERHTEGIFERRAWITLLQEVGFEVEEKQHHHSDIDHVSVAFLARRSR